MLKLLIAPLRWLVRLVVALLILFEEWGWEPLRRAFALLGRLPLVARLEARLRRLPPRWALLVLVLPSLLILPIKLLAVWLVAMGRVSLGVLLVIAAKLVGTGFEISVPIFVENGDKVEIDTRTHEYRKRV
jgi:hypothetical protein